MLLEFLFYFIVGCCSSGGRTGFETIQLFGELRSRFRFKCCFGVVLLRVLGDQDGRQCVGISRQSVVDGINLASQQSIE
jgi:hypothetical protein